MSADQDGAWRGLGLGLGSLLDVAGTGLLSALMVTGVGEAMGGRGHWTGALAGAGLGLLLGAGIAAGAHGLADATRATGADLAAIFGTAGSLGAILVGVGAIAGYTLWDANETAQADAPDLVPIASVTRDGALFGLCGTL